MTGQTSEGKGSKGIVGRLCDDGFRLPKVFPVADSTTMRGPEAVDEFAVLHCEAQITNSLPGMMPSGLMHYFRNACWAMLRFIPYRQAIETRKQARSQWDKARERLIDGCWPEIQPGFTL